MSATLNIKESAFFINEGRQQSPVKYLYDDDDECGYAIDDNDNRYFIVYDKRFDQ